MLDEVRDQAGDFVAGRRWQKRCHRALGSTARTNECYAIAYENFGRGDRFEPMTPCAQVLVA